MAAIRLEHVTKIYRAGPAAPRRPQERFLEPSYEDPSATARTGTIKALDDLNLFIPDGRTMAIVGPSGCGKSTLLRVIAGLTDYEGLVAYDDQDMRDVPVKERRIGMVFQSYALYPHFYGQGNLRFFFQVRHAPDEEAEERIRITSEMMGFGFRELLKRKPGTLSGGQQQRLAIARALVRQPDLFLLDEPLSNLDAKLRTRTRTEIKRLLRTFEITAVYVTHDQTEAIALGDQIVVMRAGRVEQVDTYQEILQSPANAFVAGFLGLPPMNLLDAHIEDGALHLGDARLPVPAPLTSAVSSGQTITVGIRPEAARLLRGEAQERKEGVVLTGTIEVVEPDFGRQQQVAYLRSGELTYSVIASLDHRLVQGYTAEVLLPQEDLYFFDRETEDRIGG